MSDFRFVRRQEVVFRDLDRHGHVNNAAYLTYLETARIAYLKEVAAVSPEDRLWIILADLRVSFRSSASLWEVLEVGARVARIGTKSLEFEYAVHGGDGRIVLEAATVNAAFDYEAQTTILVPEHWRRAIERYERTDTLKAATGAPPRPPTR